MTTPLITIYIDMLAAIKGKDFLQYRPPMKSGSNTRNPNKFCLFHIDYGHDTKKSDMHSQKR